MNALVETARRNGALAAILVTSVIAASACATSSPPPSGDRPLRVADGLPDHFLVGEHDGSTRTEPTPGMACRNPLVDPRDGIRLTLVRSSGGQGDYEVPAGKYGVGENEVLRIDCGSGRAVGIFKRR